MIVSEKSQFGIRSKVTLPFYVISPIQSQHLGKKKIMELTELELILSKNGDQWSKQEMEAVFNEFFIERNFITDVRRAIYARIPLSDREDVEQEFYFQILRDLKNYKTHLREEAEPINRFFAFLRYRLSLYRRNYLYNLYQHPNSIYVSYDEILDDESNQTLLDMLGTDVISPEDAAILSQQKQILDECVKILSPLQRQSIILRLKGYKNSEIAEKYGVPQGNIGQHIYHGTEKLYQCLRNKGILE